ncbi:hypothetical protein TTHERM_00873700 (macronuclear) [Tetrahymena thermophila SB210]|uniref:Uncharacterized protein n=1 Tax=Tetrahymena thermophila (strain SB210) TaxID=312017 RepID=Q22LI6_TETTS|nr:hypothetical protein TTHERM_00873700 [Tetrahymena thermophila SB210]EAR86154.2 hypothetical protein TTHERM_00873700 [Tetrahymena thermophila SB210]|eukprot:XP_976749.2 hypothetical protein TTHERM_00873700 [Tetrahymena thermophila SB210]
MDWDDDVDYQFKNVNQRLKELSDGQYCDSFQELFEQIKIIYNCDENQKKLEANQLLTAKQFILDFIELGTYFIVKKFTNENLDEDKMFDNLINSFSDFVNTDERMESYRGIVGLCLTMVRNSQEKKKENKEKRKVGKKTCEEQPYQSEIQQILSDMGQNKFPECFNSSNYPDTYNYLVEQINQSYQNDENYQNYQNQKNQQNQQNDQNSDLDSEIEDQNSQIEDQNSQMDYSDEDQNEDFSIDDENYLDSSKTKTRQHYQTNETDKKNIFEFN